MSMLLHIKEAKIIQKTFQVTPNCDRLRYIMGQNSNPEATRFLKNLDKF
jgi:hypothetical protein